MGDSTCFHLPLFLFASHLLELEVLDREIGVPQLVRLVHVHDLIALHVLVPLHIVLLCALVGTPSNVFSLSMSKNGVPFPVRCECG
jgi:hypothetical protein